MKLKFYALCITVLIQHYSMAQVAHEQTPCSTASGGIVGNFNVSYTIGEMTLIETAKLNSLIFTQGVIQPFLDVASTTYECYSQAEVRILPNPTNGIFQLQLNILKEGKIQTGLYDSKGTLIESDAFDYNTYANRKYDIQSLASGLYFLKIIFQEKNTGEVKSCTYKIQKLN